MQRVLIWHSVHKRQWRLVYWFAVATLRRSGVCLNERRGMKMCHYLTKVGAVCDSQEGTEVAPKVLQQHLRRRCGAVRLDRHFAAPFACKPVTNLLPDLRRGPFVCCNAIDD